MIQKTLQKYIFENLTQVGDFEISDVLVTVPTEISHGDYMTNAPLALAKKIGQNPKEFAENLAFKIIEKNYNEIEKVEIAGPGFINITLTKEAVRSEIESSEKIQTKYSDKKVLVEHSSPNLFKPFHIGHLMNNVIGEAVTRIMREGGGEVVEMSFPSDVSIGIAKALYILSRNTQLKGELVSIKQGNSFDNLSDKEIKDLVIEFGNAYTEAALFFSAQRDREIIDVKSILRQISYLEPRDIIIDDLYQAVKEINIRYFSKVLKDNLGSDLNIKVFESEAGSVGLLIIDENLEKVFFKSQGAIIYTPDDSRKDINTTVFVNSEGLPTYAGKDLGLMSIKFSGMALKLNIEEYSPDTSIYITDNEQIPHFRTVFAAAEEIDQIWADRISKSLHVPHGRMTFKGQKMSSRLGGVPLAEDTIDAVLEEVRARSGEHIAHLPEEEQNQLQRDIALSALRIAILRAKPGSNINFDPETSLSFEGDSGPYLLYTHARCASLLDKAGVTPKLDDGQNLTSVERKLVHYKEVLEIVVNDIAPQRLVTYLFELAQEFNSFYNDTTILVVGDEVGTAHRLYIVSEVKRVLKEALYTLGINAPDRM